MAKKYTGSLSLEWFNKQKSILVQSAELKAGTDVPAPKVSWVNKDDALFYEIADDEGLGLAPYWVDRSDLRVKEARPLAFQKTYRAFETHGEEERFECRESEEDDATVENILIRGDNLLALNALRKAFESRPDEEKVKCIYIDPPYNTGSAFTQFDDNLAHSEWLTLIRDRLHLLWALLSRDGSLWVSVDDDEMAYLRALMDEVCGRHSFIASNVWQKRYSRENREAIGDVHEYVLVYAKDVARFKEIRNKVPLNDEQAAVYRNPNNDPKGRWRPIPMTAQEGHATPEQFYEIVAPSGKVFTPPKGRCWGIAKATFEKLLAEDRIYFGRNGDSQPNIIRYLSEVEGLVPWTWWPHDEVGHTDEAKKEIHALFGKVDAFETPKPERLIQRVLEIATNPGDLVLDCFGGSGTTFAVAHKMGRRWIGMEVGKQTETYIIPRLKKVLSGEDRGGISAAAGWEGGGSFKYYLVGESIIDPSTHEFNWKLGRDFIENSLLSSYDFTPDPEFSLNRNDLIEVRRQPCVGFHRVGQKQMACVVSLAEPGKNSSITYDEIMAWYDDLIKFKGTQSVTFFTNRGVELAYESKPDDLEVIKVPHAIFAELEK